MFTDLPKMFDKNFVIGYLLPAVILNAGTIALLRIAFGIQFIEVVWGVGQNNINSLSVANIENAVFILGMFTLLSVLVAVVLLALNRIMIRSLEGYLPPLSWFRRIAVWKYRRLIRQLDDVTNLYIERQESGDISDEIAGRYASLLSKKLNSYPDSEEYILPTKFGNVIRASEVYSRVMYGADIIPIWPRLLSVIDSRFAELIGSARAEVNFAVNSFCVCLLLILEVVVFYSISPSHTATWRQYWYLPIIGLLGAISTYHLAISRANQWGSFIKASSDLYLNDLLKKLGYAENVADKKSLWQAISRSFLFWEPLPKKKLRKEK